VLYRRTAAGVLPAYTRTDHTPSHSHLAVAPVPGARYDPPHRVTDPVQGERAW